MPRWCWRAASRNRATLGACTPPRVMLIHPALDCHANEMVSARVKLIRLYWPDAYGAGGLYRVDQVDALARTAEKDVHAASVFLSELKEPASPSPGQRNDWPDLLAANLACKPRRPLAPGPTPTVDSRNSFARIRGRLWRPGEGFSGRITRTRSLGSNHARFRPSLHHRRRNRLRRSSPYDQMDSHPHGRSPDGVATGLPSCTETRVAPNSPASTKLRERIGSRRLTLRPPTTTSRDMAPQTGLDSRMERRYASCQ